MSTTSLLRQSLMAQEKKEKQDSTTSMLRRSLEVNAGVAPGTFSPTNTAVPETPQRIYKPGAKAYAPINLRSLAESTVTPASSQEQTAPKYVSPFAKNEDYAELSRYKSTKKEKSNSAPLAFLLPGQAKSSEYEDKWYEYVNRNQDVVDLTDADLAKMGASFSAANRSYLKQMTDEQIADYNYVYAKQGKEEADKFLDSLQKDLTAKQNQKFVERTQEYAREHPVASSAASVIAGPAKGLSLIGQLAEYADTGDIDPNSMSNRFVKQNQTIRQTVPENWSKVGQFLYGTGMSILDNLYNMALTGAFGNIGGLGEGAQSLILGIMGSSAAADSTLTALENGYSADRALIQGAIAGGIEVLTEKVSLETLLSPNAFKDGTIKYLLKNAAAEGSEEGASTISNWVVDWIGDLITDENRSDFRQVFTAFDRGDTKEGWRKIGEMGLDLAQDVAGGALSGGVLAGGGSIANTIGNINLGSAINQNSELSDVSDFVRGSFEENLKNPDASKYQNRLTQSALEQLNNKGKVSNRTLGELAQNNMYMAEEQANTVNLLNEASQRINQGKQITSSQMREILDNKQAVRTLRDNYGLRLNDNMSYSDRFNAVQDALTNRLNANDAQVKLGFRADMVAKFAKTLGSQGERTLNAMARANGYEDVEAFSKGYTQIYNAVKADPEVNMNELSQKTAYSFDVRQLKQIYNSAVKDNEAELLKTGLSYEAQGVAKNAEEGTGRKDNGGNGIGQTDVDSSVTTGRLAESTGEAESRGEAASVRINGYRSNAALNGLKEVNSAEANIPGGVDSEEARTLRIVPKNMWSALDTDTYNLSQEAEELGYSPEFYLGQALVSDRLSGGNLVTVRGFHSGKRIGLRLDGFLTPRQVFYHEHFHDMVEPDSDLQSNLVKRIEEHYGNALDRLVEDYCMQYGFLKETTDENGNKIDLYDEIVNEVLADAYAGVDIFEAEKMNYEGATQLSSEVRSFLVENNVVGAKAVENASRSARSQFSREGRGRGYVDKSMSVNAQNEYSEGNMPLSKWSKSAIADAVWGINPDIDVSKMTKQEMVDTFLEYKAWHHTGAFYNTTAFYGVSDSIADLTQSDIDRVVNDRVKNVKTEEQRNAERRNKELVAMSKDALAKYKVIFNKGNTGLKTYRGLFNRISLDNLDAEYQKVLDDIKAKDEAKIQAWEKLPEGHFRRAQAELFRNNIDAYARELYAGKLSTRTSEFKTIKERFSQAGAGNVLSDEEVERVNETLNTVGMAYDPETESITPVDFSRETWEASDYVTDRDNAAREIAATIGVSVEKAKSYIDAVNSISKMIANDPTRLDYYSHPGLSSFVSNSEYGGSFDFSTLCKKRRLMTGTITAIQEALGNAALTPADFLDIRNMMLDAGLEVSCGLCYVEGSRAGMGVFAKEFRKLYEKYNPGKWVPDLTDLVTPDGLEALRMEHRDVFDQYEYFWNHHGQLRDSDPNLFATQQRPKQYQLRTAYKGEVIELFKNDSSVETKNRNGGIRLQSFSDFEIAHLIDTMQVIMDMSRVGLAGQAYTKVPEFALAFGDTGLKINLSLITKGVDENGKLIFDDREGMNHETAFDIRKKYSKNVGTILVTFTDEQLLAAMADDRIDFIIPFHRSQWKKSQYAAMGLPKGTKDYTYQQNEKWIDQSKHMHEYRGKMVKTKATNYMPNEYWDFNISGKANAEAYLDMCARDGKRPKFYKFLDYRNGRYYLKADGSTDGYWKLLIDGKMYDNDGVGSPQLPVRPDFKMDEAEKMLKAYEGGHEEFPVARGIVDKFVEEYKTKHKGQFSRDTDYMEAVNSGDMDTAQRMVDEAAKDAGYVLSVYHGTGEYFNTFMMGDEGIHLGNEEQAKQLAKSRYEQRSQATWYRLKDVKNIILSMDAGTRREMVESAYEQQDYSPLDEYAPEFDGDINNDKEVLDYINRILERDNVDQEDAGFYMRTFDRKTGERVMHLYAKISNPFVINGDITEWFPSEIASVLLDRSNGIETRKRWDDREYSIGGSPFTLNDSQTERLKALTTYKVKGDDAWDSLAEIFSELGFDGIQYLNQYEGDKNSDSFIALHPSDVKSADPVTYDDQGNVIPLSERFNSQNNDIRYSRDIVNDQKDYDRATEELRREGVQYGIHIRNDGQLHYATMIANGEKSHETRNSDSLRPYVGQRVALVETGGRNGARVVGYATIGEPEIISAEEFHSEENQKKHLVPENSDYDVEPNGQKYAYPMLNPTPTEPWAVERSLRFDEGDNRVARDFTAAEQPRFSRDTTGMESELQKQNRELNKELKEVTERYHYFKDQLVLTKVRQATEKSANRVAKQLVKDYSSNVSADEIAKALREASKLVLNVKDDTDINELQTQLKDALRPYAMQMVTNASELMNAEDVETQKSIRNDLRNGAGIIVTEQMKKDVPDWASFRKAQFGNMKLVSGPKTNIHDVYLELSQKYGEGYFPADVANESDMLQVIADVMADLSAIYDNPYTYGGANIAEAIESCTNDMMMSVVGSLEAEQPTFADKKQAEKKEALRKQAIKLRAEALERVKEQRDRTWEKASAKYKKRIKSIYDKRQQYELRGKIRKKVKGLSDKLLKPTDEKHIPYELQGAVIEVLRQINTGSRFDLAADGSRVELGTGIATKKTNAFIELEKRLTELSNELILDENLLDSKENGTIGYLTELAGLPEISIDSMDTEQLQSVLAVVNACEAAIRTWNKTVSDAKWAEISEAGEALYTENANKNPRDEYREGIERTINLLTVDNLTPEAYFSRMGNAGKALFKMLRAAQDDNIRILKEAQEFSEENGLYNLKLKDYEQKTVTVRFGNRDVEMSKAQLMELYILNKREASRVHIEVGGILPEAIQKKFGIKKVTYAEPIRNITQEDIAKAMTQLSPEDIKIADAMQEFISTVMTKHGNDASMKVYGYKKFGDENYWPIRVNSQDLRTELGEVKTRARSVSNKGFTKPIKPNANQSVAIGSIFDTFTEHVAEMANYSSHLAVEKDINRIYNFTERDAKGAIEVSTKYVMRNVYGPQGTAYFEKLMQDLANGMVSEQSYFGGLVGKFKAAAVGSNLRVILQQPTAIFRAMDMISPRYLAQGLLHAKSGMRKAIKNSPIAQWKDWGYFDINTGRSTKNILFQNSSGLDRVQNALMSGAGLADSVSWGALYSAVEAEIKDTRPDLDARSKEFDKVVADRFADIIDHSQVVDGVLQRSALMRSQNWIDKFATAFMAEPTKQYNMMLTAIYDLQHSGPENKAKATKVLARTTAALLFAGVLNAAVQSIVDAIRDDDPEEKYWEKFLMKFTGEEDTVVEFMKSNLGDFLNPAQYVPYAKDIVSLFQGFDVERTDLSLFKDLIDDGKKVLNSFDGKGKYSTTNNIINFMNTASKFLGLSIGNVKRDVAGIANTIAQETGSYVFEYRMAKFTYNLNQATNKGRFVEILAKAYEAGDREAFNIIMNDLIKEDKFATTTMTTEEWIKKRLKDKHDIILK